VNDAGERQADRDEQGRHACAGQRIRLAPTPFPPAFHVYGNLLATQERYDEAIAVVRQGLALTPNVAELLSLLGDILASRGDGAGGAGEHGDAHGSEQTKDSSHHISNSHRAIRPSQHAAEPGEARSKSS